MIEGRSLESPIRTSGFHSRKSDYELVVLIFTQLWLKTWTGLTAAWLNSLMTGQMGVCGRDWTGVVCVWGGGVVHAFPWLCSADMEPWCAEVSGVQSSSGSRKMAQGRQCFQITAYFVSLCKLP